MKKPKLPEADVYDPELGTFSSEKPLDRPSQKGLELALKVCEVYMGKHLTISGATFKKVEDSQTGADYFCLLADSKMVESWPLGLSGSTVEGCIFMITKELSETDKDYEKCLHFYLNI